MTKKTSKIPEGFIKCGLPFGPVYCMKSGYSVERDSFCNRGLNRAGVLVKMKGIRSPLLIGDINRNCGVCDDCTAFDNDAIVVAYKVVWQGKARKKEGARNE